MSHRASASRSSLLLACGYSFRADVTVPYDPAGPAADEGNRLHAYAETYAGGGAVPDHVEADIDERWQHLRRWIDGWKEYVKDAESTFIETGFCFDVTTEKARPVRRDAGRAYGHNDNEMPGRLDLAASFGDRVEIWDTKTGQHAPKASEAGQLKTLALAMCRITGKDRAVVHIVHVRDHGVFVDSAELDALDIDTYADALAAAVLGIPTAQPTPGSHCADEWCALRGVCPATVGQLVALAPEGKELATLIERGISTAEDVAFAYPKLRVLKAALEAAEKRLREVVDVVGEVPLVNGKRLRLVDQNGRENVSVTSIRKVGGEALVEELREKGAISRGASIRMLKETA